MRRWQADLALMGIALLWGATFVMVKQALEAVQPATFIALRFLVAGLALIAIFYKRLRGMTRDEALAGLFVGVFLGAAYTLQTTGLQFTTTGKAGFITGLSIVLVPILSALLLRRWPRWTSVVGITVATAGLALLTLNGKLWLAPADLWLLGGALGFALHIIAVAQFAPRYDTVRLSVMQMVGAAGLIGAVALVTGHPTLALPPNVWATIVFTGLVATALVFTLQIAVQRFTTPTHVALIYSLESPFAALFGWWWASEVLGSRALIGCGLIFAGIIVSELGSTVSKPAGEPASEQFIAVD